MEFGASTLACYGSSRQFDRYERSATCRDVGVVASTEITAVMQPGKSGTWNLFVIEPRSVASPPPRSISRIPVSTKGGKSLAEVEGFFAAPNLQSGLKGIRKPDSLSNGYLLRWYVSSSQKLEQLSHATSWILDEPVCGPTVS